ncbi:hypothetical protein K474DRAFT_1702627 [Panus rudis PR-1116 ss-1]|nr:hypothetical protein K474DRAFT_1702627 [Panus rudis PR-1116 ss-1]
MADETIIHTHEAWSGHNGLPAGTTVDWNTALRPATIRQLLQAEMPHAEADFTMNGHKVRLIRVIAQVISCRVTELGPIRRVAVILEDGTSKGRITAHFKISSIHTDMSIPLQELEDRYTGRYVCVDGTLFKMDPSRNSANAIRIVEYGLHLVTDPHEIYYHLLHAMAVTLLHERGPWPTSSPPHVVSNSGHSQTLSDDTQLSAMDKTVPHAGGPREAASPVIVSPAVSVSSSRAASPSDHPENDFHSSYGSNHSDSDSETRSTSYHTADEDSDELPVSPLLSSHSHSSLRLDSTETSSQNHGDNSTKSSRFGRDPYSHLSLLQRNILLQFMDASSSTDQELDITAIQTGLRQSRSYTADLTEIENALHMLIAEEILSHGDRPSNYRLRKDHVLYSLNSPSFLR